VIATAIAAPTKAMRSARSRWPAPIFVPTNATSGAPRPKTIGISRYSSRAPVPYPAAAPGPAVVATNAVTSAMITFVCNEVTEATAPTPRMLRNSGQRSRDIRKRAILRPDKTYQPSTAVPAA